MTAISLVAHPDDDLLFLNPDIASDIQAGYNTWVVYLTAGNLTAGSAGMPYADQRIQGERAAYARAAKVANTWEYELIILPSGRQLATNYLAAAPQVRLVFTFINAANGSDNGDLWRMWHDQAFQAFPIEGRPSYTKDSFVAMLKELYTYVNPDFLRVGDVWGPQLSDHIDHGVAASFAATANLGASGTCARRMDSYFGYAAVSMPANVTGYWHDEKLDIWNAYKALDPTFATAPTAWDDMADRQHRRWVFSPGDVWQPHPSV
ncbi:GlcNAc-PI de-N-acetylase [Lentzea atacamensis]|uniref:GlcNAc-PI de-N-acetylase n=1 Tax=Lentzea atacamensis TaxID=531938 RepID=A0A316I2U6_9PSEU|nr:PIG-L family deacetylase [Lentzea atacamensis]PWK81739.1 GlcNAc-PI de-N-acetylase [Lentzea atacamensis]